MSLRDLVYRSMGSGSFQVHCDLSAEVQLQEEACSPSRTSSSTLIYNNSVHKSFSFQAYVYLLIN